MKGPAAVAHLLLALVASAAAGSLFP